MTICELLPKPCRSCPDAGGCALPDGRFKCRNESATQTNKGPTMTIFDPSKLLNEAVISDAAPAVRRVWSPLQEAVYTALEVPSQHILLEAVAGSGKTTVELEGMRRSSGSSLYLAFNKDIAEDTRKKNPMGDVRTFNALGNAIWRECMPYADFDMKKNEKIIRNALGDGSPILKEFGYAIHRLIGIGKANGIGLGGQPSAIDFEEFADHYDLGIPAERLSEVANIALTCFMRSIRDLNVFDFDDQLYGPVKNGWQMPFYSNIFVDECQDLNPIQHIFLEKLVERGARLIAVGDRRQAIYGFRGALSNSMDLLKSRFGMLELPLSICYRCPQSVIREAQRLCPQITARPGAPEGAVFWQGIGPDGEETGEGDPQLFTAYNLAVCRNNAPLFSAVLRHVRAKRPCRVKTNFLEGFQSFIRGFKVSETSKLIDKLDVWYEKEKEAAEAKGFLGKLAALADKYTTCKLLAYEFQHVSEMLRCVEDLQKSGAGPVFSTIHKAKGLEAPHVYLIGPDLIPAKYAKSEEQIQQEMNLLYVAQTRAQETLTYGMPVMAKR